MSEKLNHLNDQEIEELVNRYYQGEKVSDLIKQFKIDVIPSKLVSTFPALITNIECIHCGDIKLEKRRVSRSSLQTSKASCPICKHKNDGICYCENCRKNRQELKKDHQQFCREIIREEYDLRGLMPRPLDELTFENTFNLFCLFRHSVSEDLIYSDPFGFNDVPLSPTGDYSMNMLRNLLRANLVAIDPESALDAFVIDEVLNTANSYYPSRVNWIVLPNLNVVEKRRYLKSVSDALLKDNWHDEWSKESNRLAFEIAKQECIEYLQYSANVRDIPITKVGDKTNSIIENVLEDYSVGQIFNLIFQASMSTVDFMVREDIPKYKARNLVIGAIQRKADKARANGWQIKNSRRDFNCPQSIVSSVMFTTILEFGEDYLKIPLSA